jgi:hypothetical protein
MSGYIGVQPVPQATQRREYFTATSGQATFNTNGYTPNYIDVYMNGVKLSPADFTASNGSDVVLASGATTGDLVQVVSFTPFNVANQTFIGDVNLSSGAYKIGGTTVIDSSRNATFTTVTSGGLTSSGGVSIQNDAASFSISNAAADRYQRFRRNSSNSLILDKYNGSTTTNTAKFDENGDISFYEDTGTTAKFFWDSSAEQLAITNDFDSTALKITKGNNSGNALEIFNSGSSRSLQIDHNVDNSGTVDDIVRIRSNGTTVFEIENSGNVGIGTDSPSSKLHLNGTGATDAKIELQSGTGVASLDGRYGNLILSSDEDNVVAGSLMAFRVDNSEAMRITADGNVGIGTSSPSAKLQIEGTFSIRSSSNQSFNDSNNANNLTMTDSKAHFNIDGADKDFQISSDNLSHALFVQGSDGSVGINKQSPAVPLDVTGTLQASGRFLTASGSVTSGYQFSGDGDTGMYQSSVNNINFSTANVHRITIGSTGKVGIGDTATNPVSRLEVRDLNDSGDFVGATITNVSSNNAISGVAFKAYDWVQSGIYHHRGTSSASALTLATNPNTNDLSVGGLVPRLNIDNAGRVTTPYQPSFYVKDLAFSSGANSAGTAGTILHNTGAHYSTSTGRFTAPVAGAYIFYGSVQMFNSGTSTYVDVTFYKNGTQYGIEFVSGKVQSGGHYNDHHTQEGMAVIYCNASDYVNIRATRGARNQTQNVFGGYLIG